MSNKFADLVVLCWQLTGKMMNSFKSLLLVLCVFALTACGMMQPAPEVVDATTPTEKPLPAELISRYNQGLDLLQQAEKKQKEVPQTKTQQAEGAHSGTNSRLNNRLENSMIWPQAYDHWMALSESYPDYPGVWANLAFIQLQQQDYSASQLSLQKALQINAEFCPALKLQGLVERELGHFNEAEQAYLAAAQCDPNDANIPYNLGILYDLYLQQLDKALVQYQQAQQLMTDKDETLAIWIVDLQGRSHTPTADAAEKAVMNEAPKSEASPEQPMAVKQPIAEPLVGE